jgi:hypothetical protein
MSPQERTPKRGEPECLLELTGQDLMGLPLSAAKMHLYRHGLFNCLYCC